MDPGAKNYEIAYLLAPSIAEGNALTYTGKISSWIEGENGIVNYPDKPKKRKLAYPVKKEETAYFGWTKFTAPSASVVNLNKKLKTEPMILRHLVVEDELPTSHLLPIQPVKTYHKTPPSKRAEPVEQLDLEALDKKLEEILG